VCSAITTVSRSELKRKKSYLKVKQYRSQKEKKKWNKSLGQPGSKCPPNWSKLHPNDQTKKPLLVQNGPKFSIRCSKHVWIGSKLAKNGQEQDFNKVHLEKWRLGIVTRFKFVTIMYNLCKIT